VLLAEHVKTRPETLGTLRGGSGVLFQYFASELLAHMDPNVQQVLLSAAFVPRLTGPVAVELADVQSAGDILGSLFHKGYFITRHGAAEPGAGPVYEFHPLFRSFLLAEGNQRLTLVQRRTIARRAERISRETAASKRPPPSCWTRQTGRGLRISFAGVRRNFWLRVAARLS